MTTLTFVLWLYSSVLSVVCGLLFHKVRTHKATTERIPTKKINDVKLPYLEESNQ